MPWDNDFFDEAERVACDELNITLDYLFTEASQFMAHLEYEYDTPQFMMSMDINYDGVFDSLWNMLEACYNDEGDPVHVDAYTNLMNEHIHTLVFATGRIMEHMGLVCTNFTAPKPGMHPLHTYICEAELRRGVGLYISFDFSDAY